MVIDERSESDYKTRARAFHIRISNVEKETYEKIRIYYEENKNKIKHILISAIEYSKSKKEHYHMTLTFYNQTTGSAILKAMLGNFKEIGHYISPKLEEIEGDDGNIIKISYKMFYNYVSKNGISFEEGIKNKDDNKEHIENKPLSKKLDSNEKKLAWYQNAENKTPREFKEWMIINGYAANIYDPWVDKLIKDRCRDTLVGCMERFHRKNKPIRCMQLKGGTGVGKTLVTSLLFPNHFAVNKGAEKPFDRYDAGDENHDTIVINEINDIDDLQKMGGVALLENLADEQAVPIDTKWNQGEAYIRPCTILLVGNFGLQELVEEDYRRKQHKADAHRLYEPLLRRFREHNVDSLLKLYEKRLVHDGKYYDKGYQKTRLRNPRLENCLYKNNERSTWDKSETGECIGDKNLTEVEF